MNDPGHEQVDKMIWGVTRDVGPDAYKRGLEAGARKLLEAACEAGVILTCAVDEGDETAGLPRETMIGIQYGPGQAGPICTAEHAIDRLLGVRKATKR